MRVEHLWKTARRTLLAAGGLSTLLLAAGCRDFLDPKPDDVLAAENFYKSGQDAITAVNAAYAQHIWFYNWLFYQSDVASDDAIATANFGTDGHQLAGYTFDASLWSLNDSWSNAYLTINRANIVIDRVPPIVMDSVLKARVLGEARYIRALMYFNLVRMFGGVPRIEHELKSVAEAQTPRATEDEIYQLIIGDLQAAKAGLPTSYTGKDVGRATTGAAQALLAKVYLTRKDWNNAAKEAGALIAGNTYSLNPNYRDNFRVALEFTNPESIYEVSWSAPSEVSGYSGSIHTLFTLPSPFPGGDAYGLIEVNPQLVSLYSASDRRGFGATYMQQRWVKRPSGDSVFAYVTQVGDTVKWSVPSGSSAAFAKWYDPTNAHDRSTRSWQSQPNNWIVLRYADVLLMYAEAVANGGTATAGTAEAALNQVRARAGIPTVSGIGGAILDTIRVERRREFAFEGQRWFDLARWDAIKPTMAAKQQLLIQRGEMTTPRPAPSNLFPIPQSQINTNGKLNQNPGW